METSTVCPPASEDGAVDWTGSLDVPARMLNAPLPRVPQFTSRTELMRHQQLLPVHRRHRHQNCRYAGGV